MLPHAHTQSITNTISKPCAYTCTHTKRYKHNRHSLCSHTQTQSLNISNNFFFACIYTLSITNTISTTCAYTHTHTHTLSITNTFFYLPVQCLLACLLTITNTMSTACVYLHNRHYTHTSAFAYTLNTLANACVCSHIPEFVKLCTLISVYSRHHKRR